MGRAVTLDEIKEDVRQRCDLPTYSTTTFITTAAVTRLINTSLQSFYALLIECYGDDYFLTFDTSLTTTANFSYTALPADFVAMKKLYWLRGTGDPVEIIPGNADDYLRIHLDSQSWDACQPRYRLAMQRMMWLPKPSAAYDLRLWYVYAPADLAAGADTFQAGPGWDEWVVLDVCRKIAEREERDPGEFISLRGDAETRIRGQAPDRYQTDGAAVRDVMGPGYGYGHQAYRDWLTRNG